MIKKSLYWLSFGDLTALCVALQDVLGIGGKIELTPLGRCLDTELHNRLDRLWRCYDEEPLPPAANDPRYLTPVPEVRL